MANRLNALVVLVLGCGSSSGSEGDGAVPADGALPADAAPGDGPPPPPFEAGTDRLADLTRDASSDTADRVPDASTADPPPGAYGTRAPLLDPNSEMAVATAAGKVFVLGGYPSSRVTQRTLQVYDIASNSWTRGLGHPIPIHHPVLVGVGEKIYSLGGQPDTGRSFVYDPARDSWMELAAMPTARGGGAGAAIGARIYVVGGRPPAGNAFEVYDLDQNAWTGLPDLPARFANRNHLAAGAIGGKIYVAGGRYDGGGFDSPRTDALDVYDPASMTWTARKPLLRQRGGMSGVVAFGCLYVYGGEGQGIGEPNDVYPDHDVYNPTTDTWTSLAPLRVPFHGVTGGVFADGLIYMPGGGTTSGGNSGSLMHQVYRPGMRCDGN